MMKPTERHAKTSSLLEEAFSVALCSPFNKEIMCLRFDLTTTFLHLSKSLW